MDERQNKHVSLVESNGKAQWLLRLATVGVTFFAVSADAQDWSGLPEQFVAKIKAAQQACSEFENGQFALEYGAVHRVDLDGDIYRDWILDEAGFACSTAVSLYCGTGGCMSHFLVEDRMVALLNQGWDMANIRDDWRADPATMPDSELKDIAGWAWKCRLENSVYRGRDSVVSLHRLALDALRRWDNETDAIALYVLLSDMHGHRPGKRFALDFKAMRTSGLTQLSVPRLRAARRTLEAVGLVELVGKHRAGSVHQTFSLARLHNASQSDERIVHLGRTPPIRQGEGS